MRTLADLIVEWFKGGPRRTASSLSRATGVPRNTISAILSGNREPGIEVAAKLARALPRHEVAMIVLDGQPEIQILFRSYPDSVAPQALQLCSSEH
ncbi:helix-turn-helix domain-containing protein [Oligoflexus sp.]|uniref:helix-turn-helix domain-containing protein n=1 Tax=Oligoflexus sp. TaxID=1971216 RepID=UPI0039C8CA3F